MRRALRRLLGSHGYEVELFADGNALLAAQAEHQFDCILLDLHMPGMSGFDVASALRERPETADLPVVVLTAHELDAGDRARLQDKIEALVHKGPLAPSRRVTAIRGLAERRAGGGARA